MDCEQAKALISAQIDGELATEQRVQLDAHLTECAACREMAAAFRLQDSDLRRVFAPRREAAEAVADRVIAQLRTSTSSPLATEGHGRSAARHVPWLPMILSAAAGFLIAMLVFHPWQQHTPPVTKAPIETPDEPTVVVQSDTPPIKQPETQPAKKATAELAVAIGVIEMLPPGSDKWERMGTGGTIDNGTRVRTGPEGRCEFLTQDGSEVRLNGDTDLLFHTNRKLELDRGQVWSTVAKADDPYQVSVPRAEATVTALGTQFDIECKPEETLLTVVEGVTKVEGLDGKESVQVHAKERAKIVGGAVAEKQRVYNLVAATSWVHEILKLKGHDNPELTKRMDDLFAQIGEGKMTHLGEKEIIDLGDHCVLPLTRFIQSERSRANKGQRVAAARILAKIAQPWSVPDLIDLLSDDDAAVRYHAAAALERLTKGETQGLNADQWSKAAADRRGGAVQRWQQWWEKNKEDYPKNPFAPETGPVKKGIKA